MKVGDLVRLSFANSSECVGLVVESYCPAGNEGYTEFRVRWLDDAGKDVSWVMGKDLSLISKRKVNE